MASLFSDYKVLRIQLQLILHEQLMVIEVLPWLKEMIRQRNYELKIEGVFKDTPRLCCLGLPYDELGKLLQKRVNTQTFNNNLTY